MDLKLLKDYFSGHYGGGMKEFDEWGLSPTLERFNITDDEVVNALNERMDNWADAWLLKDDQIEKSAYLNMLLHLRQLKVQKHKGEIEDIMEEFEKALKKVVEEG